MNRLSRYRLHPTGKQQTAMSQMLRDHCRLDNAGVAGTSRPVPRVQACQQQTPRQLDKAFAVFFARIKAGQTPGYPRFAPVARFDTVTFVNGDADTRLDEHVRVHGVRHVKVTLHRAVAGTVKQVSLTRQGRHWFAGVIGVDVPAHVRPLTGAVVGIDCGVRHRRL
jgi:putative transposase